MQQSYHAQSANAYYTKAIESDIETNAVCIETMTNELETMAGYISADAANSKENWSTKYLINHLHKMYLNC